MPIKNPTAAGTTDHAPLSVFSSIAGMSNDQTDAAILDIDKGELSKNNAQILVVDDSLVQGIKWIKEGFGTL